MRIALAQLNPKVGDISGNLAKVRAARAEAAKQGADLVLTAELVLAGYFPEDLVLKPAFQQACKSALEELAADTADGGPAMLVGSPWADGEGVYNGLFLLAEGKIAASRFKHELPNYGVFDEKRVFKPGPLQGPVSFKGVRLGLPIGAGKVDELVAPWDDFSRALAFAAAAFVFSIGSSDADAQADLRRRFLFGCERGGCLPRLSDLLEMIEMLLGQLAFTANTIQRLQRPRFGDVAQKRDERFAFGQMPDSSERFDNERRVAKPAVTIIPGSLGADRFGNTGRRGGNDGAGSGISVQLEAQRRSQYRQTGERRERARFGPCPPSRNRQVAHALRRRD